MLQRDPFLSHDGNAFSISLVLRIVRPVNTGGTTSSIHALIARCVLTATEHPSHAIFSMVKTNKSVIGHHPSRHECKAVAIVEETPPELDLKIAQCDGD